MAAKYLHIGIPITTKKEGMVYNEGGKFWFSNPEDYDFKIEYLKFEEGTPFPEALHREPHVAYQVDDMDKYLKDADEVLVPPMKVDDYAQIAFIRKDGAIIELFHES